MRTAVLLAVAATLLASAAVADEKPIKDQLVGSWALVSAADSADPKVDTKKSVGASLPTKMAAAFTPDGRVTWTIEQGDRRAGNKSAGPTKSVISGSYTVDEAERTISYHVDQLSYLVGSVDPKTTVAINGDRLELVSQQIKEQPASRAVRTQWRRVSQ